MVLVGDAKRQHRAVEAGQPLLLLEESGLPVAEVNEILRQSWDYLHVTKALGEGKVAQAVAELDQLGWIREIDDDHRYRALAEACRSCLRPDKGPSDTDLRRRKALEMAETYVARYMKTSQVWKLAKREGWSGRLLDYVQTAAWVQAQLI